MSFEKANLTAEQATRFDEILVSWQASVDLKHRQSGFTHPSDKVHYHVGGKYARFDIGGSGAFMVEIETGTVYGIKGYGKVDKKKDSGNIYDPAFNGSVLVRDRFRYGRFTNNPDGSPVSSPKEIAKQLRKIANVMEKFTQSYEDWVLLDQDGCVISQLNVKHEEKR